MSGKLHTVDCLVETFSPSAGVVGGFTDIQIVRHDEGSPYASVFKFSLSG